MSVVPSCTSTRLGDDERVSSLQIPGGLLWWRRVPGGAEWLARLPMMVAGLARDWDVVLDDPLPEGHISLVVPGQRGDGTPVVLKVNFPEEESEHEADALRAWDGTGAVRLLAHAAEARALLLERLSPGRPLWDEPDLARADEIATSVLRRLWRPLGPDAPYRRLDAVATRWRAELPERWEREGRLYERELLDEALAWIDRLVVSMGPPVVVHQDFHGGNVLWDERRGWLAIDPKPLAGEPAFDTASLLRDRSRALLAGGEAVQGLRARLDRLAGLLELDRERMRGWGMVHALAWLDPAEAGASHHARVARTLANA
jgi:streptomycin 6-kinase